MYNNIPEMRKYAEYLRKAAELETNLIGSLILDTEAFGPAMLGRAERVEQVLNRFLQIVDDKVQKVKNEAV